MKGTVITNSGIQLLVKLAASGRALEFSRAAVGTGQIPTGYDPQNMINLNAYKMDGTIASCSAAGDTASIVFQLSSEGVTTGFTVTEAGIYAIDPDRGEILYSYLDMTQDPQYVYADGSTITKFIEMTLNVVIGSAANVTTYINPNSLIKREEFETGLYKKVDILGGDISDTVITAASVVADEFPDVDSEEKPKTFMAKTKKFFADFKEFKNAIITVSRLANNGQVTEAGFALDARYGKTLYDLYSELYSDLIVENISSKIFAITVTEIIQLTARRFQSMCFASFTIKVSADTLSGLSFFSLDSSITPSVPAEGIAISADNEPALAHSISVSNTGVIRFTAVRANNIYNGSQIKGQIVWFI